MRLMLECVVRVRLRPGCPSYPKSHPLPFQLIAIVLAGSIIYTGSIIIIPKYLATTL